MRVASTPKRRSSPTKASTIGLFSGRTGRKRLEAPSCARATATLASPPPNGATNGGESRKRSKPGGARRSMTPPKAANNGGMAQLDCSVGGREEKVGGERMSSIHRRCRKAGFPLFLKQWKYISPQIFKPRLTNWRSKRDAHLTNCLRTLWPDTLPSLRRHAKCSTVVTTT